MGIKKNKISEGLQWSEGTICNIRWGGVLLRDILLELWPPAKESPRSSKIGGYHVAFGARGVSCQKDDYYESSIPLSKILDEEGEVLLAFEVKPSSSRLHL
jgi:sulfite oxidase